jgi:hypothetical protein
MISFAFALALAIASAGGDVLDFDRAFSASKAPTRLYYEATYHDAAGKGHELRVWRDGKRLRRDTDDTLSLVAEARGDGDVEIVVLDHAHRVEVDVSRSRLHQLGAFADWSELATSLTRPRMKHTVARITGLRAPGRCTWFAIEASRTSSRRVCWSAELGLPLAIDEANAKGAYTRTFEIKRTRLGRVALDTFALHRQGYAIVDGERDADTD